MIIVLVSSRNVSSPKSVCLYESLIERVNKIVLCKHVFLALYDNSPILHCWPENLQLEFTAILYALSRQYD